MCSSAKVFCGFLDSNITCHNQDADAKKYHKDITFTAVLIFKHRRLGRIPHSQDYIYQAIRSRIQSSLLFGAIAARDASLVSFVLECKPLDIIRDVDGRTPLHAAALLDPPHEEIATVLVNAMPRDTIERDNDGQVPLHLAVFRAWLSEPPVGLQRSYFSNVIRYLMRNMQRTDLDTKDHDGQSPWDQLCDPDDPDSCGCNDDECASTWIRELKENLEPISGPAIAQDHEGPIKPRPPEEDSPQYRASIALDGTVSEFYHAPHEETRKLEERINLKTPSVYTMIYDSENGCARILQFSRVKESLQDFRCRWIHGPANNEQWLSVKPRHQSSTLARH
jgi:hypothetical protein